MLLMWHSSVWMLALHGVDRVSTWGLERQEDEQECYHSPGGGNFKFKTLRGCVIFAAKNCADFEEIFAMEGALLFKALILLEDCSSTCFVYYLIRDMKQGSWLDLVWF